MVVRCGPDFLTCSPLRHSQVSVSEFNGHYDSSHRDVGEIEGAVSFKSNANGKGESGQKLEAAEQ
jgi:hypothetical protein